MSYPFFRRTSGPQSWVGHFGEDKNLLLLLGIKSQIIQLVVWSLYLLWLSSTCISYLSQSEQNSPVEWLPKELDVEF
jgi:hypothetical protein